jgi:hypothetical protein
MRCARQAAAIAAISAIVLTGAAAPATAATDPTRLWSEFPLDPKARDAVRARLRISTPPAPVRGSDDKMLFASGLAMLFVSAAGAAVVALSVILLRDRYYWYRDRRYY